MKRKVLLTINPENAEAVLKNLGISEILVEISESKQAYSVLSSPEVTDWKFIDEEEAGETKAVAPPSINPPAFMNIDPELGLFREPSNISELAIFLENIVRVLSSGTGKDFSSWDKFFKTSLENSYYLTQRNNINWSVTKLLLISEYGDNLDPKETYKDLITKLSAGWSKLRSSREMTSFLKTLFNR